MKGMLTRELVFASRMSRLRPSAIREILKTTESPDVISFAGGLPAPELFPSKSFQAAAETILTRDSTGALQYGLTEGFLPLREFLCEYLQETVGLRSSPSSVLITQGSQQGLDLLAKVLIDPGDVVMVETPAYLGALQAFQSYEAETVGVRSDDEGMCPDELEHVLIQTKKKPKFLYLICNYQNPTGKSMSLRRRREVAEIAARHDVLVVEDDPYGRLRFDGETKPGFGALPECRDWVYLGSTSKILAPGLRVGWLATSHQGLFERLVTAKQAADLHTGSFTQRLVYTLMSEPGWLDRHVLELCKIYGTRRDVMLAALQTNLPKGTRWTRPEGGLFVWVTLPGENFDSLELLKRAAHHKVAFVPGAPFWVGTAPRNTLRLNFSNASEEKIQEGMRRLGTLIADET